MTFSPPLVLERCDSLSLPALHLPLYAFSNPPTTGNRNRNRLKEESKVQPANHRRTPDIPPRLHNRLALKPHRHIKQQMAHPVQRVERKRPRRQELERALGREGQRAERRRQRRALQVPADEGRGQIRRREHVQAAAERRPRDAHPDRPAEPRLLLVVHVQVRRHRPVEPLLSEDRRGVGGGELLRRYGPVCMGGGYGLVRGAGRWGLRVLG